MNLLIVSHKAGVDNFGNKFQNKVTILDLDIAL